jgi:hypothetical protein
LLINPTNTASGSHSLLADFQLGGVSQWKVDESGNSTQAGALGFSASGTLDTGISRGAALLLDVGNGNGGSFTGFLKTAQFLAVTGMDFTCGTSPSCTSPTFLTITGLSAPLPLFAANWSFSCDLVVSQATTGVLDKIGVQTATNQATSLTASAVVGLLATGQTTDQAPSGTSVLPVVNFTPTAGTKYPVHLAGTIEGVSASGTTLNIAITTSIGTDTLTVYRGSSCWVY